MPQATLEKATSSLEPPKTESPFSEAIVLMDDDTWVWNFVNHCLQTNHHKSTKLPSNASIRHSWNRFQKMPFLVIHWENKARAGGAIIEEIMDIDRNFNISDKIIVITTHPVHEDVVAFSELGIRRVIRPRHRDSEIKVASQELINHIQDILSPPVKQTLDSLWRKIINALDKLPENPPETLLQKLEMHLEKLGQPGKPKTARELDAQAVIQFRRNNLEQAIRLYNDAISLNPNYFRAWNGLIQVKRSMGQHEEAYNLMQKLQLQNRNSVSRLVAMGEAQLALNDARKAEHYFKSALDKDSWNSGALNGLAEVKFSDNDLDEARSLLAKSNIAYKYATKLNLVGIELVNAGKYEKALEHYSKAQYVLPQQEKGPQLLYNIALCYAKWGRAAMSEEFLKLALVKEPNYKKASRLLEQVRKITKPEAPSGSKQTISAA